MPEIVNGAWADGLAAAVVGAIGEFARVGQAAILPSHHLEQDLGIDSLEFVRVIQTIEEEMAVLLDDRETAAVTTVADLIALVRAAVKATATASPPPPTGDQGDSLS